MQLVETDIRSDLSKSWVIRGNTHDNRDWLQSAPSCPQLEKYQILHLGVAIMPAPFHIVRTNLGGSYFLASLEGEGRVLVDGKWVAAVPGQAVLLPPRTLNAFFTPTGMTWKFCWIRYLEGEGQAPIAKASSPVIAQYRGEALENAILGLWHESSGERTPRMVDEWVHLVHAYAQRFASPEKSDPRLALVWKTVSQALERPWTVHELAAMMHVSEKQFQRLCHKELGRSPQQQLMWLRMRRAAEMLGERNRKISSVAMAVGYRNPFVFSSTFKRILGWSPSEYAGRLRGETSNR